MIGSGKDRISGLLTSRIVEQLTTHRLGTPITLPWEAETIEEQEKKMKRAVEECNFTSPELVVTDEQGKHSTSVKQDGVKVQHKSKHTYLVCVEFPQKIIPCDVME